MNGTLRWLLACAVVMELVAICLQSKALSASAGLVFILVLYNLKTVNLWHLDVETISRGKCPKVFLTIWGKHGITSQVCSSQLAVVSVQC